MAEASDPVESGLATREGAETPDRAIAPAIPPLGVTGLVVTAADLVRALRIYVPQLIDVRALDEGRFLLSLTAITPETNGRS